jgi:hypothetical protein
MVEKALGGDYALSCSRHHSESYYPTEYHPQTQREKILQLANQFSSGNSASAKENDILPLPQLPLQLMHVLSRNNTVYRQVDLAMLERVAQQITIEVERLKTALESDPRSGYLSLFNKLANSPLQDIPANTGNHMNDVSLWDHLKLTAAFATCIWLDGGYKGDDSSNYEFALISGDADKISSFVNLSSRLPDLNARSERVRVATEAAGASVAGSLGPECLIFCGGGGLLAISPVGKAEEVCQMLKASFEAETQNLVSMTANFLKASGSRVQQAFGEVWKEAQWLMRQKKNERPAVMFENLMETVKPCDICRVRPTAYEDSGKILRYDASARSERLCEQCWRIRKDGYGMSLDQFKDRSNHVAVLRADGDDIGKVLGGDKLGDSAITVSPSRLSTISRHIHKVCENTLAHIVSENGKGKCLIAGGDDMLAIVAGDESLMAARHIASTFKKEMAEACTMSAGVAIFRYDLPIYVGLEAADRLLRLAKQNKSKDSIAFAFLGSAGMTPDEIENVKHGPRKWSELDAILRLSEEMRNETVSSSQIRKIAVFAKKDPAYCEILIKSLMGREERGKGVGWSDGEKLLFYLHSGILLDAFSVYNAFKT